METPIDFLSIDHVQIAMPPGGEPEARRFYGTVLGLEEVPKPPILAVRGGAWFEAGDVRIHLGVEEGFRAARKAHPAIRVADLGALSHRLTAYRIEIHSADPLADRERFYVDDPFGNRLEFLEMRKDTP